MKKVVFLLIFGICLTDLALSQGQYQPLEDQSLSTTSSPKFANLTVTGNISASGYNTGNKLRVYQSTTDLWDLGTSGNVLSFSGYNGTFNTAMQLTREGRLFVAGNVGLGTLAPTSKLTVIGDALIGASTGVGYTKISWNAIAGTGATTFDNHRDLGSQAFIFRSTNTANNNFIELMRITGEGNVGIGNASPAYKLDVNGSGNIAGAFNVAGALTNAGGITINPSANAYREIAVQRLNGTQNSSVSMANNRTTGDFKWIPDVTTPTVQYGVVLGANSLSYYNNGTTETIWRSGNFNPASYLPLAGGSITGKVTIGTTLAQKNLDVNGEIKTRKVTVTATGWADYVFDSSYRLSSLPDVEAFIRENKHLPDVPSAAEVEKEGISLGENQVVLLKKIEELTLYIIRQNKQIEEQNKELLLVKKRLNDLEAK